jgi:hypothetical protein
MRWAFTLFALIALPCWATTYTVVAHVPTAPQITNDGFLVLPGSHRQINALETATDGTTTAIACDPTSTPACLGTINWRVVSTTGGASLSFSDSTHTNVPTLTGALPMVDVTLGAVAGNCATTPDFTAAAGPYTLTSTATVTVEAQLVDDPAQTADFTFFVCAPSGPTLANGTSSVYIVPTYAQVFKAQPIDLTSFVTGQVDETGTWAITSQPVGGDGVLADTNKRDTVFSATVTGRYSIQFTSTANGGTQTAVVYVSPNPLPPYAVTPEKTIPVECYPDPGMSGTDYEVGSGKTYADLAAIDPTTVLPGSIIRVWNEDTTGTSPTTYRTYFNIAKNATAAQPSRICGVPDSLGNLPVLDGDGATTNPNAYAYLAGYGIIYTFPATGHYASWMQGSVGPSYWSIAGLHVEHAHPTYSYYKPGSTTLTPWVAGSAGVYLGSGTNLSVVGMDIEGNTNGVFTAANGNNAWATITSQVLIKGNHIHASGLSGSATYHQIYDQSWFEVFEDNLVDNYTSGASGSNSKFRGVENVVRNNYYGTGASRDIDFVEVQDAVGFVAVESMLPTTGVSSGNPTYLNVLAGYQEGIHKDFVYGNILNNTTDVNQIHYYEDSGAQMNARTGDLWFYNNTMASAAVVFDASYGNYGAAPYFTQSFNAQNNIFWARRLTGVGSALEIAKLPSSVVRATTNLFETGSINITTPIMGGNYSGGGAKGWDSRCDASYPTYTPCPYSLTKPIDAHLYGLTSVNYLTTSTLPYDPATFIPVPGSAAIGAGSPLTGLAAQLPVRFQYNAPSGAITARTSLSDIGAVQSGSIPVGTHTATLSWTASPDGGTVTVYRASGTCPSSGIPSGATILTTTAAAAGPYVDSTVTVGAWCYYLTATDNGVTSEVSNASGGSIIPFAPTNLSLTVE